MGILDPRPLLPAAGDLRYVKSVDVEQVDIDALVAALIANPDTATGKAVRALQFTAPPTATPMTVLRSRNIIQAKSGGNILRYAEARSMIVVRNFDSTDPATANRSAEICFTPYTSNPNLNPPVSGWVELPAGQEAVDAAPNSQVIWVRTKAGNANAGTVRVEVYVEVTV